MSRLHPSPQSARPASPAGRGLARFGPRNRLGFTLLEVIVSVGLTTLIVAIIGSAIRMYFVNLRQAQSNMELTELARNTLQLMASDIRGAIQYKPVDVSGLQELIDSQSAALAPPSGGSGEDESGGDDENGQSGEPSDDENSEESADEESNSEQDEEEEAEPATSEPPPPPENRPKFIGSGQELYVDTSRLPRIDQYHPILHFNGNGSYTSLPTDVKSVSYFISMEADESAPVPGGLYRREVDRATVGGASDPNLFSIDAAARQVAAEVVSLSFRYFDGESWQGEWDSDEVGGFPMAVEITIMIDPTRANPVRGARYDPNSTDPDLLRTFRTVTKLPLAELLTPEEQELIASPTEFSSPAGAAGEEGDR